MKISQEKLDNSPLGYQLERFVVHRRSRYLLINRQAYQPPLSISLFETALSHGASGNTHTPRTVISNLAYLYTWADTIGLSLDEELFAGRALPLPQIRQFAYWLAHRGTLGGCSPLASSTYNGILSSCSKLATWFVEQYARPAPGSKEDPTAYTRALVAWHRENWRKVMHWNKQDAIAPDLTDTEIERITWFLTPENRVRTGIGEAEAMRDYLMWLMVYEFGLRIGELLALRLNDCYLIGPHPYIRIVRVDERGQDYLDPRAPYDPKVKTRSRELGFLTPHSKVPELIDTYADRFRVKTIIRKGQPFPTPILPHDYLLISHTGNDANPLSIRGAQKVAERIAAGTGIPFYWHLGRHAFFNRRYAWAANQDQNKALMDDLVYWGGWRDEKSLAIYTRRARRDRARSGLRAWQSGQLKGEGTT